MQVGMFFQCLFFSRIFMFMGCATYILNSYLWNYSIVKIIPKQ